MGLSDANLDRVWRWDNLVHLLVLVGWQDAAERAHACRTAMVQAGAPSGVDERAAALVRRIARARSLRWSLRGVGPISAETCKRIGLPPSVAGDSYTRLRRMMDRCLEPQLGSKGGQSEERSLDVAAMPSVLVGVDLAVARVVLASLNLRPARVAAKDAPDA